VGLVFEGERGETVNAVVSEGTGEHREVARLTLFLEPGGRQEVVVRPPREGEIPTVGLSANRQWEEAPRGYYAEPSASMSELTGGTSGTGEESESEGSDQSEDEEDSDEPEADEGTMEDRERRREIDQERAFRAIQQSLKKRSDVRGDTYLETQAFKKILLDRDTDKGRQQKDKCLMCATHGGRELQVTQTCGEDKTR
jgi:hypothetical protein